MRYGYFDDDRRDTSSRGPTPPFPGSTTSAVRAYFGLISNTAGGYSFFRDARLRRVTRYRYNNAPFDLGGRYIYLRDDAIGRVLVAVLATDAHATWTDYECRHGMSYTMHRLHATTASEAETLYFVPLGENLEIWQLPVTNRRRAATALGLLRHRVLPVGRPGRRHQLPAQLQHRRSRGRGRRHLPQDRVPGAAQPLRLFRLLGAALRLRHRSATRSSAPTAAGMRPSAVERGESLQLDRPRLGAHRLPPCQAQLAPRRDAGDHLSARLLTRTRPSEKFDPPRVSDHQQRTRQAGDRPLAPAGRRRGGLRGLRRYWDDLLSAPGRAPRTPTPTGWSTSGTPTSAW